MKTKINNVLLIVQNNSFPFDKRVKKEALSLSARGYSVYVISPNSNVDNKKKDVFNQVNILRYIDKKSKGSVLGYFYEYLNSLFKIYYLTLKVIITKKINFIHVANPPDFFWPLFILVKIFGVKSIYDQHDLAPELYNVKFNSKILYKILLFNEKMTVKYADGIITANKTFVERLKNKFNIQKKNIEVIYNGPENNFDASINTEIQIKFKNKKVALFVGLMSTDDNLDILVEIGKKVVYELGNKDTLFLLVGDGDVREKIEELVSINNLEEYFHFTGIVDHFKVQEYLYIADVCLVPDLPNGLNEQLTLIKVLEYMKARKAFVGFKLTETMNLANQAGMFSQDVDEFAKNLDYLLKNPLKCKEMGEIGAKIINENYLWDKQEEKLVKFYKNLLNE